MEARSGPPYLPRVLRTVPIVLVAALAATSCSQRVTPEEEYVEGSSERPVLPPDRTPPALTSGGMGSPAGAASAPMGGPPGAPAAEPSEQAIRGTVSLSGEAPSGGVLYVFVRPAGSEAGPPLAVQRFSPVFPLEFAIGPEHAMMAGTVFPERVHVEARLDLDGNAMTTGPDDLEARSEPVAPGASGVALDLERP